VKYGIGIDLGTTHTALSYINLSNEKSRGASQSILPIPQLTAAGTVESKTLLPSFLYLALDEEFPAGSLKLPWNAKNQLIAGEFARSHGLKSTARLVSSAKSWLCHAGVDRRSGLLPFFPSGTPGADSIAKISPVEASEKYLSHVGHAWNQEFKEHTLNAQSIVLTVPASFDAAARDLTLEAATQAGLKNVTLLEEPQAALYAWLEAVGDGWRKVLQAGDVILVVDVGGGTSDFSLIRVDENAGNLELTRLAVGDHILLGGDNMDLALAHVLSQKIGKTLDEWQMKQLTFASRAAKEKLFEDEKLEKVSVAIAGRGSSLVGGTIKTELLRAELTALLVDGFFPAVESSSTPTVPARSGLAQQSLPYAADAAITKHLASFLSRQATSLSLKTKFARPTSILFNGGVFKANALRERLLHTVNSWLKKDGAAEAKELQGADCDLAVARGAAYYAWVKAGHGIRIRGGTARAYYVGVESSSLAIPGFTPALKALCVASFGMEEGTQATIPPQEFGLTVGEETRFRFFSSSTRRDDKVGDFLPDVSRAEGLEELPPIETKLDGKAGVFVPVNIQAAVTELGALEVRCVERGGKGKWKLELNVRV
jgi:molecular chaperone DnaK (HSP70)